MTWFQDLLFWIYAFATCGCAIAVVVSQNVVRMAFWLILSLGSSAGLFFLLGADFVASAQLLVYVGGTLVLLIFGVMLTASGPFMSIKTSPGEGLVGGVIGLALLGMLAMTVTSVDWEKQSPSTVGKGQFAPGMLTEGKFAPSSEGNSARSLGLALLGARPEQDLGKPAGGKLTPGYLLPFEIVSVHLLVVLIGAAYLARAKRREKKGESAA
ncbi:MAG: NADH-quinone oxidoreductase subunit J [Planctomycetaceae bacterium]|nr:NADH-quinone oxidoreductase subunit J [Planctomycetaceae bacterium]